jgi:hypothetical protein
LLNGLHLTKVAACLRQPPAKAAAQQEKQENATAGRQGEIQ